MDIGITSYGVYIPRYRLGLNTIAQAWKRPPAKGEKAVANFDEDSFTLAIEAVREALVNASPDNLPDTVFFCSTTFPYKEKLSASMLATFLDLPETVRTRDFGNSLRSGTSALLNAFEMIKGGSSKSSLVTAVDCRLAQPGSDWESFIGDGSGCLLVGADKIIARIVETYSISSNFTDLWRKDTDNYLHSGDIRFGQEGYHKLVGKAITSLLKKTGLAAKDFAKIVLVPRDKRSHLGLAKKLGFDPKTQLQNDLVQSVGFTGTAHSFIMLIAALEESKPKDKILLAGYGDGVDVLIFEVTEEIEAFRRRGEVTSPLQAALARRKELTSYTKFLEFRNCIKDQPKIAEEAFTSLIMQHREQDIMTQLKAKQCVKCRTILTLRQKICSRCNATEFTEIKLTRQGKIYTYTQEHYYPSPEPPTTMAVVDLEGGGRILLQTTDTDADKVKIGLSVKLTYRKMHEAGGFYNYYWKCRAD